VRAMEAAITFLDMGTLSGKTVAIQGGGRVGKTHSHRIIILCLQLMYLQKA